MDTAKHLIAQKVAEIANKESTARIEKKKLTDASLKKVHTELLAKSLEELSNATITLRGKASEKGHLFASIHKDEVLTELKRATRIEMNPDYVILDRPLKELGTFEIPVVVEKNRVTFTVVVEGL